MKCFRMLSAERTFEAMPGLNAFVVASRHRFAERRAPELLPNNYREIALSDYLIARTKAL